MRYTARVAGNDIPLEHALFLNLLGYDTRTAHELSGREDPLAEQSFAQVIQKLAGSRSKGGKEKYDHGIVLLGNLEILCEAGSMQATHETPLVLISDDPYKKENETDKDYALLIQTPGDCIPRHGIRIRGSRAVPPKAWRSKDEFGINSHIDIYADHGNIRTLSRVIINAPGKHQLLSIPNKENSSLGYELFWKTLGTAMNLQLKSLQPESEGGKYISRAIERKGNAFVAKSVPAYDHEISIKLPGPQSAITVMQQLQQEYPAIQAVRKEEWLNLVIPKAEIAGVIYVAEQMTKIVPQPELF